jgi:predicted Zn-dependent peptidase
MLVFRVGSWDETARTRGITHVAEHLALFDQRNVRHAYNGHVVGSYTVFWASGSTDEVTGFFSQVTAACSTLPTERIETESGVLAAEAAQRPSTQAERILGALFGPNGPGLESYREWGLGTVDAALVQQWAGRHFTRSNAVFLVSGEPPANLVFDLQQGSYQPFQLPSPDVAYRPGTTELMATQPAGICLGARVSRSTAAVATMEVVARRLTEHLRHKQGLAYSVSPLYLPLDRDEAFAFIGADTEEVRAPQLAQSFFEVIEDYARSGPDVDEMDLVRKPVLDADRVDTVGFARSELQRVGLAHLLGYRPLSWADIDSERQQLEPTDLQDAFESIASRALVIAPEGALPSLPARRKRTDTPVAGTRYLPSRLIKEPEVDELIVGDAGISGHAHGRWVTLAWDDLVLALDSESALELLARTGSWLYIEPAGWRRRDDLRKQINRWIPRAVRLQLPAADGQTSAAEDRDAIASFVRIPPLSEAASWLARAFPVSALYVLGVGALLVSYPEVAYKGATYGLVTGAVGAGLIGCGELARRTLFKKR